MITTSEAFHSIEKNLKRLPVITIPLMEATGYIVAEDVYAAVDMPPFAQSAMDGYAFSYNDWDGVSPLQVVGEVAAGQWFQQTLKANQAVRIFTGAALPATTDTVVMQEKVEVSNDQLLIQDDNLKAGANVRPQASQTRSGELVVSNGVSINAGVAGFLATLGIAEIQVYTRPRIKILVTGSELIAPGRKLEKGSVYESNSFALFAALKEFYIDAAVVHCNDNCDEIAMAIRQSMEEADLLLITGGISVGDYDFVLPALKSCAAEIHFHKVKQKPAKPLAFATGKSKPIFALPGNPASVLTCFYVYVLPAIQWMQGHDQAFRNKQQSKLTAPVQKKSGLTHFLKARIENGSVTPLTGQESYRMDAFVQANAFIRLEEEITQLQAGEYVEVIPF
ncbi:MAG: gephyrin-like molybdotransferase Glp [Bacteroidia bacterium]|jgi:molybdopterin molybdotransferase